MNRLSKIKLTIESSIREALQIIDTGAVKFALVVDSKDVLLGTLTDGDIRRAILEGKGLESTIEEVYFRNPTVVKVDSTREEIINLCTAKKIYQIPVVDDGGKVVAIKILDELLKPKTYSNKVILMVGGLGSRLRPLTESTPKPMLHVGGKPILVTIVEKFASYGFVNILMCVGYKSNIIQDYFGDGSKFGVNIEYIIEDKRMGTAGALSLLSDIQKPKEAFFVMNGDLLTNLNFENLLEFHISNGSKGTMAVREYDFQVPYGVVDIENGHIIDIKEKPLHKFFVSAGIYMLNPDSIGMVPSGQFYDMPTLFEGYIAKKEKVLSFPLREYWLDIGGIEEYEKANIDYNRVF